MACRLSKIGHLRRAPLRLKYREKENRGLGSVFLVSERSCSQQSHLANVNRIPKNTASEKGNWHSPDALPAPDGSGGEIHSAIAETAAYDLPQYSGANHERSDI